MATRLLYRAVRSAGAIVVATTAVLAGTCLPAQAGDMIVHFDDMEAGNSNPATRFTFESNSAGSGGVFRNTAGGISRAHSGSWSAALLNLSPEADAWVSVGKKVTAPVSWYFGTATTCRFSAWVHGPGGVKYVIQVLDANKTNYVTSRWVQQPVAGAFGQVATNTFTLPSSGTVFLRVKYMTPSYISTAFVDDFQLQCTYV